SLYMLCWGAVLVGTTVCVGIVFPELYSYRQTMMITVVGPFILCHVMAVKGFQQSRVYDAVLAEEPATGAGDVHAGQHKYQTSSLSAEDVQDYHRLLTELMEREKLNLRPRLKLSNLARESGMLPQQVSQVINQCAQVKFYDFVNGYGIEEALRLMREQGDDADNILAIALASGLNSPTTFYKYFRKHTGQAPRDYRQPVREPDPEKHDAA
ncbi:MAG: AraC family transcriptional regulator, partial [Thiohalobacterales bacterium]|nr:AraC family transcriptional regulator [Thiohalobacterales bacterium]